MSFFRPGLIPIFLSCCLFARAEPTLLEARHGFQTKLVRQEKVGEAPPVPPSDVLKLVHYRAPLGDNAAYVSLAPIDGKKHPAIIWIVGGFSNSISGVAWSPGPRSNDQSASGFRSQGIVMMYPSLRGGNTNPGCKEGGYGEVDDLLAAAKYLASLDYVDASRIYLGGHSTGGTLVLLVAAVASGQFRAAFSLGPAEDASHYGPKALPCDFSDPKEIQLRSPQYWLADIRCPTFVFEGIQPPSNLGSLLALRDRSRNPQLHFLPIAGVDHFSIIAPLVAELASAIRADDARAGQFTFNLKTAAR